MFSKSLCFKRWNTLLERIEDNVRCTLQHKRTLERGVRSSFLKNQTVIFRAEAALDDVSFHKIWQLIEHI